MNENKGLDEAPVDELKGMAAVAFVEAEKENPEDGEAEANEELNVGNFGL